MLANTLSLFFSFALSVPVETTILPKDTIPDEYTIEQVVITGTRTPKRLSQSPVLTRIITSRDIANTDATDIRDILQQVVPGVEFSYAMNQQIHLNFSGFGGQSVLVLVDGERLAGETMDDVDFSRITPEQIDHIEIVRGSASALYGSNAVGGVINIVTKDAARSWKANVNGRWGKHGSQRYGLSWQQGNRKLANILAVNHSKTDNYRVNNGEKPLSRVFSTVYGDAVWNFNDRLVYNPTDYLRLTGRAGYFFRRTKRSVDTPEQYRDFSAGLGARWQPDAGTRLEFNYAFDQYDKSIFQRYSSHDIRLYSNVHNAFRLLFNRRFDDADWTVGIDYLHDYLFNTKLDGSKRRQDSFDAFMQYDWNISPRWEVVGALRYDYFSDGRMSRITPKLSVRYRPLRRINIRGSYGMGFRTPTLKEKYYDFDMAGIWIVEGNPHLNAEVSHNFCLSGDYSYRKYNFSLSGYYNKIKDKIATGIPYVTTETGDMPRLPYINLSDYSVFGMEATVEAGWSNGISTRVAYSWTRETTPKDNGRQINNQYIPMREHSLTVHGAWEHRFNRYYAMNIAIDGRYVSGVENKEYIDYHDIARGVNTVHYPAYSLWKLFLQNCIGKSLKLNVTLDNLLNYRPAYYYLNSPVTDGISVMVGVSVDIDKMLSKKNRS